MYQRVLNLDIETFSTVPIKHGTHRYAEEAEVLLVQTAFDDEPVHVEDVSGAGEWGAYAPKLQALIDKADVIRCHKSDFERTVLRHCGVHIPVEKIEDTMVIALQHSLPSALGTLCDVLGVPQDKAKDKDGKKLIHLFTKPRPKNVKLRRATRETHPDEWQRFIEYARLDVAAMRDISRRLPRWNCVPSERHLWLLDQETADRGIACDLELAKSALRAFERASGTLADAASKLTDGAVTSTTQRDRLLAFIAEECGVDLENMQKGTLERVLRGEVDPRVRALLENRLEAAATSTSKYTAFLNATSSDGRLRGTIQFCGASRTFRDAGRLVQLQNLPRPSTTAANIEMGIAAMKADCEDLLYDVSELCVNAIRGCLVASPSKKLVISDLSNIEGRVLAWLANEAWKLKAFRDYDAGIGHDLYKITAGRILGKSPEDVTKADRQNPGKISELACLGPDTRVITSNGVKPIIEVTAEDLIWDGHEWVQHTGLVDRGLRRVLNFAGVEMTPDHRVLARGNWLPTRQVVSSPSFRDLVLETGAESLRLLDLTSDGSGVCLASLYGVHAARHPIASRSATGARERAPDVTPAPKRKLARGLRIGSVTRKCARTTPTADACATASRPASTAATTQTTRPIVTMGVEASASTNLGARTGPPFLRTSLPSGGGTSPHLNSTEETMTGAMSRVISASSESAPTATTCAASLRSSGVSTSLKRVYDIANAGPRNRFTVLCDGGALVVHNCGYQGAVGAFRKMGGAAVEAMDDAEIATIVKAWRAANSRIKALWYDVDAAMRSAIGNPGEEFIVRDLLHFATHTDHMGVLWLRVKCPGGLYLSYREPEIAPPETCDRCGGEGKVDFVHEGETHRLACPECNGKGTIGGGEMTYMGTDTYTKQWKRLKTYGGHCVENITQHVARMVFFAGFKRAMAAGYKVVLRVHDELVCEVPDTPEYTVDKLSAMLATNPGWSAGLPLAAAGHECYRYSKED